MQQKAFPYIIGSIIANDTSTVIKICVEQGIPSEIHAFKSPKETNLPNRKPGINISVIIMGFLSLPKDDGLKYADKDRSKQIHDIISYVQYLKSFLQKIILYFLQKMTQYL